MKFSQAAIEIERACKAKVPIFLWGAPGVGKSSCVEQGASEKKIQYLDQRTCSMDPVDVKGFPENIDDEKHGRITSWIRPEFIPSDGEGVLFLDELPQSLVSVMNSLSELILNRRVGKHKLGDGWSIVAAGNRMSDRAATNRLPSHIASRFVHIQLDLDENEWYKWAIKSNVIPEIIAFLRFRPTLLSTFGNKDDKEKKIYNQAETEYAFACPRSWEFLSRLMTADWLRRPHFELVAGTVGQGAASDFLSFLSKMDKLPDIDYVIKNPTSVEVPNESGILYALMEALARRVTIHNFENITRFLVRIPNKEYMALCMGQMKIKDPRIQSLPQFTKWAIENAAIMT